MVAKSLVNQSLRSWRTAAVTGPARIELRDRGAGQPILVHQMGKVASSALAHAIDQVIAAPVYHTHFLSDDGIDFANGVYRNSWDPARLPTHVWESQRVRRLMRRRSSWPWTVVSAVRDPVARNISSFFQIADLQYGIDATTTSTAELHRLFLQEFDEHDRPLTWFDFELDRVFDIDTFGQPFPHEQGWTVVESPKARVGVVRYEDLESGMKPMLAELLGIEVGALSARNSSETKAYGDAMSQFYASLTLPESYLDWMYNSKYAMHFYSDDERARFRERWTSTTG